MLRYVLALNFVIFTAAITSAHCQVPCGIYGDQLRFEHLLEDHKTIAKAQQQVIELAGGDVAAQAVNQMARWVMTKEEHAQHIQEVIANYFLAQRIKPDAERYTKQLTAAHAVILTAMKCKQSTDPATADALEKSILDLYRAYEGKEPDFAHEAQ